MAVAGYTTTVRISGTPTDISSSPGEGCNNVSGDTWQVANANKRIMDPATASTFGDNSGPRTDVTINPLFGIVTFGASSTAPVYWATGKYIPTVAILEVMDFDLTLSANLLDVTTFDSGGVHQRKAGLLDCKGKFNGLAKPIDDLDSGTGGVQSLQSFLENATPKLLEIAWASGDKFRGWILLENIAIKSTVDGRMEVSADFSGAARKLTGWEQFAGFGWGS